METKTGSGVAACDKGVARDTAAHRRLQRGAPFLALLLSLPSAAGLAQQAAEAQAETDSGGNAASTAVVATAARIDALQALASGEHPGVPIDSVLNVSLDDDSSMIERDKELRLLRRQVTIALGSVERFTHQNKKEHTKMRDTLLAMDLERKVLALPAEVRARLIEVDANGGAPTGKPEQASTQEKAEPRGALEVSAAASSNQRGEAAAPKARAQAPKQTGAQEASDEPDADEGESSSRLLLLLGLLFGTWLAARLSGRALGWLGTRFSDRKARLEQVSKVISLFIWLTGGALTLLFGFSFSLEVLALVFGTLGLTVALAMRELASSLLAGVLLILRRPFDVGDQVEFDQVQGKVTEIGLTSVRVLTPQQRIVHIPNRVFLTQVVSSQPAATAMTPLQVDFLLEPNQDIATAKRLLKEAADELRSVELPKSGGILVNQVTVDRMVAVRLRCKLFVMGVQPTAEIRSDLTERVLESFRKSGLRAPSAHAPAALDHEQEQAGGRIQEAAREHAPAQKAAAGSRKGAR